MMQTKYPQKPGIDFILKQAFFYWNKTLVFQLMFSIIFFGIALTAFLLLGIKYEIFAQNKVLEEAFKEGTKVYLEKVAELSATENYQMFMLWIWATMAFLYPLNLGMFQIFRKLDLKEKIVLGDLFAGYNGLNFFKFLGYYLFWFMIYRLTVPTFILAVLWVAVTIFVAPLMFFTNKRIFEAISLNFKALKMYFMEIMVCIFVATLFKYLGFALFLIGGLFTFPFWNAMIYSLYKTIFSEKG